MPTRHLVQPSQHLSQIAALYGYRDYHTVWNHPLNDSLRATRSNPNVLEPGDIVFVPDHVIKEVQGATTIEHHFRIDTSPLRLDVTLVAHDLRPVASTECEFSVDGASSLDSTDEAGVLRLPITTSSRTGNLHIGDRSFALRIGDLDPVTSRRGAAARLGNLGYYLGSDIDSLDDERFRLAVEEFQCDNSLPVDGTMNDVTAAVLVKAHRS